METSQGKPQNPGGGGGGDGHPPTVLCNIYDCSLHGETGPIKGTAVETWTGTVVFCAPILPAVPVHPGIAALHKTGVLLNIIPLNSFLSQSFSGDEMKPSSLKDIYHQKQRENGQLLDWNLSPSQSTHPPEVTVDSLVPSIELGALFRFSLTLDFKTQLIPCSEMKQYFAVNETYNIRH